MITTILKTTDINEIDEIYNLSIMSNYYQHIRVSISEISRILVLLLKEYISLVLKKDIKNTYVIHTGLNTLLHVFNITFYYTKNLKLSCYYTQQAYHVYLDFINALGNPTISYLNLKTKDAVFFVYKKTIFEICNEYKKTIIENSSYNMVDDITSFKLINKFIPIYKLFIHKVIYNLNE